MRFSTSTCFLASLVATLVLMTKSLPQSTSGRPNDMSKRKHYPKASFNFYLPKGCIGVPARHHRPRIGGKLVKRDSQSSGTPARALVPRFPHPLPCGAVRVGGLTDTFRFIAPGLVTFSWNFGLASLTDQVIRLMRVIPDGPDIPIASALALKFEYHYITVSQNFDYYIQVEGRLLRQAGV